MKNLILVFCLLLIGFMDMLSAQDYVPMPTSNAIWSEYEVWWDSIIPELTPYYMVLTSDTTLNEITYHKITQTWGDTIIDMSTDHYWGCYREDTNKVIYYIPKDSINEVLIYDFSRNVGDTIFIKEYEWTGYILIPYIIDQVDSVIIEGNYRKVFFFKPQINSDMTAPWIEGVGSISGVLYSFYPYTIGGWWEFNCLTQNGNPVYQNPESHISDCFGFMGIELQNAFGKNISISPNPSRGIFQINCENFNSLTVTVYSVFGKMLFKKKLIKTDYIIDLSNFNSGMYLVKITDTESKHSIQKKIIIKK